MVIMAVVKGLAEAAQGISTSIDSALDMLSAETDTSEIGDYTEGVDASDDDMVYNPRPPPFFASAKKETLRRLSEYGINDSFTLRIKSHEKIAKRVRRCPDTAEGCLALYRGASQFGSGPIFWIRDDFEAEVARLDEEYDMMGRTNPYTVAIQTLLHEYGHVIYEWARWRDSELLKIIEDAFDDEEDFAEDFMRFVMDDPFCSSAHAQIIRLYVRSIG